MREILFRGKRKDNGEWVEGWFLGAEHIASIIDDNHDIFPVDPETVCEYTGLTDKNGIKIFEEDILKHEFDEGFYDLLEVIYDVEVAKYQYRDVKIKTFKFDMVIDTETVIGNIHDNPDLLGGAE